MLAAVWKIANTSDNISIRLCYYFIRHVDAVIQRKTHWILVAEENLRNKIDTGTSSYT